MEPLFKEDKYYSRVIVRAMMDGDMSRLRQAMLANQINVVFDAIEADEDIDVLKILASDTEHIADCDELELMRVAREQKHWEYLDL